MGQNYAYCIRYDIIVLGINISINTQHYFNRPAAGYCCIEYTPVIWSVFGGSIGDNACVVPDAGVNTNGCSGAVNCNNNFIVVPGVQSPQSCKADGSVCYGSTNGRDRY